MNDQCAEYLANLMKSIEHGNDVPPELKSHLATCAECGKLLDAMTRIQADIERGELSATEETVVEETVQASGTAVFRSRQARTVTRAIAVAVTLAAAAWMIVYGVGSPREGLAVVGIAFLIIAPLFVVIAVLHLLRERLRDPVRPIYKRLKPGMQLAGVCLGLSEAIGQPAIILRVAFFILFFVDGLGFWAYVVLALLMPTHPDDRQYLLRFRIARAFRRVTNRG